MKIFKINSEILSCIQIKAILSQNIKNNLKIIINKFINIVLIKFKK